MVLQVVDSNHSTRLFDVLRILVGRAQSRSLLVDISDLQDVLKTVKGDLNDLVVHRVEQVAHGFDAALLNEVSDLSRFLQSTGSGVRDGPTSFLFRLEVGVLKNVDKRGDDIGVDDGLDLHGGTGGDVRNGPASLLSNAVFGRGEQAEQCGKSAGSDDNLCLQVVSCDNVSNRSKSRGLHSGGWMPSG